MDIMTSYCMTSGHVSISPPSVPCHQATISLAWSKNVQCPMAASPHAFSSHLRFPPGLLFVFCSSFLFRFAFYYFPHCSGENGWRGVESTLCLCDASDGACCNMLTVAHRTTPHSPPPPYFWTPSIVRWLPHSICASCLPPTGLQYDRAGLDYDSQSELQPKPAYLLFYSNFIGILRPLFTVAHSRGPLVHCILTVAILNACS